MPPIRKERHGIERIAPRNFHHHHYCGEGGCPGGVLFGRVINISSLGGRTATGDLTTSAYGVSKAGLIGFTRILAREVASQGITVNVICPGRIETNMASVADPVANADYLKRTPVGRFGTPEEVADMVAYLAGTNSAFVTGACLDINGGVWMGRVPKGNFGNDNERQVQL